jgi:RNA polymerase sigma-70 factor (ECF subfamily)
LDDVTAGPAYYFSRSSVAYQFPSVHARPAGTNYIRNDARIAEIESMILNTGRRDHGAFFALYDSTSGKQFSVCLRILMNRTEAEDALQDAFVNIWRNAHRYTVNGYSPMTWLITVARNVAISRLRVRKPHTSTIDDWCDVVDIRPTPQMAVVRTSERAKIEKCLKILDQANADAVRGAYLDGRTYQDLADCAGVPINTMRTRLRRSLLKLRICLSK